jgi:pimeloyl-ACP methyl ester carboxylesterase
MDGGGEMVILVHGLWLHGVVFAWYRRRLARGGFASCAFSYPSVRRGLSENAAALAGFVAAQSARRIHLVGHSLGGLVVLAMLAESTERRLGRVVLLGSPVGGSHCATGLARWPGGAALLGRSLRDWMAAPLPQLPAGIEIGVLAGSRSLGLGRIIRGLPKPNDGVVAVAETRLAASKDSVVLPVAHSQMLFSPTCIDQVASFLTTGNFSHA